MTKQTFAVLLSVLLLICMTACSGQEEPASVTSQTDAVQGTEETAPSANEVSGSSGQAEGTRILIAYFSRVGNTEFPEGVDAMTSASLNLQNDELVGNTELIAQMIQQETQGDLFRIETEKSYPADYDELVDYGRSEPEEDSRPALASHVEDMESYDIVFLGFPNWWFDMPMAVYSFLDEYDFSGKTIIPFCTHGGSGFSDILSTLETYLPDTEIQEGFEVHGESAGEAQTEVQEWLNETLD